MVEAHLTIIMKNLFLVGLLILGFSFVAQADSWSLPTKEKYCSENKKYCLTVEPKKLDSQLAYFQDKVDEKKNAGADKRAEENFCKGTFYAKGKKLWKSQLDNEVAPVSALVSNDGDYIITFDNWHGVGYGDNVVAIYDGATGNLIKKLGLTDFLTESDVYELPASTNSIQWHGTHQIDYARRQLILKVVKPSKNNDQFFDVHIALKDGTVLDKVVDRIPSLQFSFSTKDIEEKPKNPVKETESFCDSQTDVAQISTVELNKKILQKEMPKYPPAAKAVRATGESVFEVIVSQEGVVECVKPISGHPLLRATLINSIKKWQFEKNQIRYKGKVIINGEYFLILDGKIIEQEK